MKAPRSSKRSARQPAKTTSSGRRRGGRLPESDAPHSRSGANEARPPDNKGKTRVAGTVKGGGRQSPVNPDEELDRATLEDADRFLKQHRSLFDRLAKL
jgi:hypothetical protein